ncbi:hypothetical protein BU25DRAFT_462783 [Macroventuria anomochaeta]|uniref:Uncharacterized protein n=1 Tax=Macroventuria anomochaeta TaxID=301207 RepID=A0ACB6RM30_9PLEO|nr:uncharacterized protein BU25DRAFT_462783 [Macroventuria anomochaeta]KAF2622450.1 hypothetical protein BU25DRAFT_462783 [Macroventuria anomochaeta]
MAASSRVRDALQARILDLEGTCDDYAAKIQLMEEDRNHWRRLAEAASSLLPPRCLRTRSSRALQRASTSLIKSSLLSSANTTKSKSRTRRLKVRVEAAEKRVHDQDETITALKQELAALEVTATAVQAQRGTSSSLKRSKQPAGWGAAATQPSASVAKKRKTSWGQNVFAPVTRIQQPPTIVRNYIYHFYDCRFLTHLDRQEEERRQ